jgi:hypothetical protein
MICCTALAIFNVLLLGELGAYTDRPVFLILFWIVLDAAALGASSFSHLSVVHVVVGVACLDAAELCRTALVRLT